MKILVLNSGSSSVKYRLYETRAWSVLAEGRIGRIGEPAGDAWHRWRVAADTTRESRDVEPVSDHEAALGRLTQHLETQGLLEGLDAIGHRVVHGGERFHCPVRIDEAVVDAIAEVAPLAPLHNPANLAGIEVARHLFPEVAQVAVFDTAFHQTLPPAAWRYALPDELHARYGVRRYGFHGISHAHVTRAAARWLGRPLEDLAMVSLHLGNGASAAAVAGGRCVETSMGMTPLEGLVMGTRSGDLDPAVPLFLQRQAGMDAGAVDRLLNHESGLTGLCGTNDLREVHRRIEAGDPDARLALEVYCHRLRKYIGAYAAVLGRLDVLIFTAGVGENDAEVRQRVCDGLDLLGIGLDARRNRAAGGGIRSIARSDSAVAVLVVPTDEEREIARATREVLRA